MTNWWPLWNHSETTLGPLRDHSCLAIVNMETTLWSHGYQIGISGASLCRIYGHFQLSLLGWEVINSQLNQYIRLIRKKFRILNFIFWCVGQFLEQIFCRLTGEALSVGGLQLPARNWSDTVWDLSYHRNNNFFLISYSFFVWHGVISCIPSMDYLPWLKFFQTQKRSNSPGA